MAPGLRTSPGAGRSAATAARARRRPAAGSCGGVAGDAVEDVGAGPRRAPARRPYRAVLVSVVIVAPAPGPCGPCGVC